MTSVAVLGSAQDLVAQDYLAQASLSCGFVMAPKAVKGKIYYHHTGDGEGVALMLWHQKCGAKWAAVDAKFRFCEIFSRSNKNLTHEPKADVEYLSFDGVDMAEFSAEAERRWRLNPFSQACKNRLSLPLTKKWVPIAIFPLWISALIVDFPHPPPLPSHSSFLGWSSNGFLPGSRQCQCSYTERNGCGAFTWELRDNLEPFCPTLAKYWGGRGGPVPS